MIVALEARSIKKAVPVIESMPPLRREYVLRFERLLVSVTDRVSILWRE